MTCRRAIAGRFFGIVCVGPHAEGARRYSDHLLGLGVAWRWFVRRPGLYVSSHAAKLRAPAGNGRVGPWSNFHFSGTVARGDWDGEEGGVASRVSMGCNHNGCSGVCTFHPKNAYVDWTVVQYDPKLCRL
jgi:hypothetical protein